MTPTRNEILSIVLGGFLLILAGTTWLYGAIALISCGAAALLSAVLLGFVDPDKKKE